MVSTSAARGSELLEAVYAAPERDGPRLVYADWLAEHGDARAELIALQCARARRGAAAPSPRERQLMSVHAERWLGPLRDVVSTRWLRFERGFAARGSYRNRPGEDEVVARHRAWSTFVELDVAGAVFEPGPLPLLLSPATRRLRAVDGLSCFDLRQLMATGRPLAWRALGGVRYARCAEVLADLCRLPRILPRLTVLSLVDLSVVTLRQARALLDSATGAQLTTLRLPGRPWLVEQLERLAQHAPPNLACLELVAADGSGWRAAYRRTSSGRWLPDALADGV